MDTAETGGESVEWTALVHSRIQWVALVRPAINLMGSYKNKFLIVTSL
jgi:hypothetical protein